MFSEFIEVRSSRLSWGSIVTLNVTSVTAVNWSKEALAWKMPSTGIGIPVADT